MSHRDRSIANTRCEAKRIYHQRKHINRIEKDKKELQQRIDKAINKVQYIIDYGFDYDGFNQVDSLKGLIDVLVDYARQTKDILRGGENNR